MKASGSFTGTRAGAAWILVEGETRELCWRERGRAAGLVLRGLLPGADLEDCEAQTDAPQLDARRPRRAAPHREVILPLQARRVASRARGGLQRRDGRALCGGD